MAIDLPPATVTRQERTFRVERETPLNGEYRLVIHREIVSSIDGVVIAREPKTFAYNQPASVAAASPAFATYLSALQSATSADQIIAAESALYDALVSESQ